MYFSINAAMLRSQKGARLLSALPRDRVLSETDGPCVATGRKPAAPATIPALIGDRAGAWECDPEEAREQVWANMAQLAATADMRATRSAVPDSARAPL